jgi:hypothetical protein
MKHIEPASTSQPIQALLTDPWVISGPGGWGGDRRG